MSSRKAAVPAIAILLAAAAIELAMGRHPICTCGTVDLWVGARDSPKTSQMLSDWYSLSHVVHGLLFYALLWLVLRRWSVGARFLAALLIEASWEVIENTPFIIDRYRAATISLDYYGDSIINSMSDIVAMMIGFAFAARVRWWVSAIAILVMEIGVALVIRDNLLLNILMLIHPFEAIKHWQAGG